MKVDMKVSKPGVTVTEPKAVYLEIGPEKRAYLIRPHPQVLEGWIVSQEDDLRYVGKATTIYKAKQLAVLDYKEWKADTDALPW
jgi:hypothetical protein